MTTKQRKALMEAAELIATKECDYICYALPGNVILSKIPEAKMIDPGTNAWWGMRTMGFLAEHYKCRNARLIGIAMMLTMPKSMIK